MFLRQRFLESRGPWLTLGRGKAPSRGEGQALPGLSARPGSAKLLFQVFKISLKNYQFGF
jgi:hypothetical protein